MALLPTDPSPRSEPGTIEIRLHGRGGQGGVTCAKILAAVYASLGRSVQSFGDYAGERSGAPVRAYTRVSDRPIENRNKVYAPDHLLVLDPTLLSPELVAGLTPGGLLLLNTPLPPEAFAGQFDGFTLAVVDAVGIARRHGIGTRSVVIVNTTIAGAYARAAALQLEALEDAYAHLGLTSNLPAAKEAWEAVQIRAPLGPIAARGAAVLPGLPAVLPLVQHLEGRATGLKTGAWRTQAPGYVTKLAPCNAFCPAGNDVVGFVQALSREEGEAGVRAAAAILGKTTPLAAVCGRVCPAPCMDGCNRRELDGAVNIRGLERWISDRVPVATRPVAPAQDRKRLAIVGGGPAGISAAYLLAQAGHAATVFEAEGALGGVLRTGIPVYRLPREALDREVAGLLALGVTARCGERLTTSRLEALAGEYDGVILATGLQRLRAAGVPGEEKAGVEQGIRFLHRVNLQGGAQVQGHVVVLGGGNTALDCARSAKRSGAARVTIVYRRSRAELPAIPDEVAQAEEEGIEFLFLRAPVAFEGDARVAAVRLAEVELGPPDATGRRSPVVTERTEALACDAVLLALGQTADLSLLPAGWTLAEGRISRGGAPAVIFAAGDLATGDGTVTHAIGDGRRAASRALRALGVEVEEFVRPDRARAVAATEIKFDHFPKRLPARSGHRPAEARARTFEEVETGLPSGDTEADRCFSCGHCTKCDTCLVYCPEGIIERTPQGYAVDLAFCKGCGLCVRECPRTAMEMT